MVFTEWKNLPSVEAAFKGIRPAVVALIAAPLFKMAKAAKITWLTALVPVAVALLIWLLHVNPVWVILATIALTIGVVAINGAQKK
jgi:chromate transporter